MVNLEDVSDAIVSVCVAVSCLHMGMYTAQRWRAQVGVGCFVGGRGRTLPEDGSALVWPFYAVLMPCLAIPCHPCLCPCAFHSMYATLPSWIKSWCCTVRSDGCGMIYLLSTQCLNQGGFTSNQVQMLLACSVDFPEFFPVTPGQIACSCTFNSDWQGKQTHILLYTELW